MADSLAEFDAFRKRMNDLILGAGNLTINRFFALDNRAMGRLAELEGAAL